MKAKKSKYLWLKKIGLLVIIFSLGLHSCSKVFEFSPYSANVDNDQLNTNNNQWQDMDLSFKSPADFSFAVIGDIHYHYDELAAMIGNINKDEDIEFVVIVGDIADQALLKEYEFYYEVMKDLDKPYFTLIGNHDYNANGETIYQEMFGPTNFDFEYQNIHFVFFDDVFWESNTLPNFDWLERKLEEHPEHEQVVFSHIPPFGDQFTEETELRYAQLMAEHQVMISIHGHTHGYYYGNYYMDEVPYLILPWAKLHQYAKISIRDDCYQVRMKE